jgi:ABC-type transport system substrate-binding protein
MTLRRILIYTPLLVVVILLQSYFWVPSYKEQTRGNPDRLNDYMTASIGDASLLNPILSSDASSSEIESMVFDGLIDLDEDLLFRGRLATSWDIHEEAFFYVNKSAEIPGFGKGDPEQVADLLRQAQQKKMVKDPGLKASLDLIKEVSIMPPQNFTVTREEKEPGEGEKKRSVKIHVKAPHKIKLVLKKVDQDLFNNLTHLLGTDYFSSFSGESFVSTDHPVGKEKLVAYVKELLPATEHNPIIQFQLRPGVKFHDGHIFDADDVRFTYEAIMNPDNLSPRTADYEPVKAVEVLGPLKIRIVYKRLYSPAIGTWAMGVLPEHLLNADALEKEAQQAGKDPKNYNMRQSRFNRHPTGTGPFRFQEWKADQHIALDRYDSYWEGPPNYKRFIYRIIPDLLTQEMEFYSGTLDAYGDGVPPSGVPPHQVDRLRDDPTYQSFTGTSFGYDYVGYNARRELFKDAKVRKALGMAIDVGKIIKYVLFNQGETMTGPFVKQTDYYNRKLPPLSYDPEGALRLLNEAGWKRNDKGWLEKEGKRFQFTLISNSGNDRRKAILAIVQDAWKQIGIDVRTDLLEWSVFIQERINKLDFDAVVLGWVMPIEPDLYQVWHSSQANPYQLNFVGFRNEAADELIIRIRQEYDHDAQVRYSHKLHKIIYDEQPYTFLYVRRWTTVLDKRIVIKEVDDAGKDAYKKIVPTKTGDYRFHFNRWVKLAKMPQLVPN